MAKKVFLNGQAVPLSPKMVIGQGGEAVIYGLPTGKALKFYMDASDPTYAGNPSAQAGATVRLREQQTKLPAFPTNLPPRVVAPSEMAYSAAAGGEIIGYTMPLLSGMEVLMSYGDRRFREQKAVDANQVVNIFRDLYGLVDAIHAARVVIGDFNDLNVLVDNTSQTHLIDADSMQYGQFPCRTFTARFVDPLLCPPDKLQLVRPHSEGSDWYAFATMLFQSLLYINPYYGGVHRPKSGLPIRNDGRVLNRLTVLSPEVIYPKMAQRPDSLPDELLDYFTQVYEKDQRGTFPLKLLENMRWTACTNCGLWHSRAICPACAAPGQVIARQSIRKRGTVTATRLLRLDGASRILFATTSGGTLRYLYHEAGAYKRETRQTVLNGPVMGELRIRISGDKTVLAKGNSLATIAPAGTTRDITEVVGRLPVFDANVRHTYWIDSGRLVRDGKLAPVTIGTVLSGQTLMWVGDTFGFGFYRAGSLTRGFVFDAANAGINDGVKLPVIRGNLIDATCTFAGHQAWFMLAVQDQGVIRRYCYVVSDKAEILAQAASTQGDGSWLDNGIRGHLALGSHLYVATDTGIARVGIDGGGLSTNRTFPDTEPFVNTETQLLAGDGGILAISTHDITLLKL
jgi:hypothetical protein